MTDTKPSTRRPGRWAPGAGADPLDQLIHLSNLMGQDTRLVQPGGGNTSTKLGDTLLVKGSGTDLRTITRDGFTRLSLSRLAALRDAESMSDAEMMRFMAGCMLAAGPAPSVETPLHALLPQRVIAHTHDVATMSLTNVRDDVAKRLVAELFEGRIVYVPYVRPGFPLAQAVATMADSIPAGAIGLTLAHHGLVVWGDDAEECHARLVEVTGRMDEYLVTRRKPLPPVRPSAHPPEARRWAGRVGAAPGPRHAGNSRSGHPPLRRCGRRARLPGCEGNPGAGAAGDGHAGAPASRGTPSRLARS